MRLSPCLSGAFDECGGRAGPRGVRERPAPRLGRPQQLAHGAYRVRIFRTLLLLLLRPLFVVSVIASHGPMVRTGQECLR